MKKFSKVIVLGGSILIGALVCGLYIKGQSGSPFTTIQVPQEKYDVIVIGSDPEGISAAVSAARNGQEVLLIDHRDEVGGLMTLGGLNSLDMNFDGHKKLLTRGVFEEFFNGLHPFNFTKIPRLSRYSYDVAQAIEIFERMLAGEENLEVILGAKEMQPLLDGSYITGIQFQTKQGQLVAKGEQFIDATQDGDIAAQAGVPYAVGMSDLYKKEHQAVTLVFKVEGVNWKGLRKGLNENKNDYSSDSRRYSAWGFADVMKKYEPVHDNVKVRGPNIGLQNDGSVLINAIQILEIDGLSEEAKRRAFEIGEIEAEKVTEYMKQHIPGFEKATYGGVVEELYIRETRHIEGEYTLDIIDLVENRDFEDKIALGSYPVDIQTTAMNNTGYVLAAPETYSIPLRSIVPKKIDNLLVVGRAASFSSLAHGSARVIPIGMAVGEAAGVVAAHAIEQDINLREIAYDTQAVQEIQKVLRKQGAYLEDFHYPPTYEGHWATEGIQFMIRMGLLSGGYTNDFGTEKVMAETKFLNWLIESLHRSGIGTNKVNMSYSEKILTVQEGIEIVGAFLGMSSEEMNQSGLVDQVLKNMKPEETLTVGAGVQLIYEANKYLGYSH